MTVLGCALCLAKIYQGCRELHAAEQQRAMILEMDAPQRKVFRLSLFHPPGKAAPPIQAELESRAKLSDLKAKLIIETIPSPN